MLSVFPRRWSAVLALVSVVAPGCWYVPPDDAGDQAFAVFASVAVLGRRPRSPHELSVLADLAAEEGREAVVAVLMEEPAYVDHWSLVLMDALSVLKEGGEKLDNANTCFNTKKLAPGYYDDLIHHLRYQSWKTPFCPSSAGWLAPRSTLPPAPPGVNNGFTAVGTEAEIRRQFDLFASRPGSVVRGAFRPNLDDRDFTGPHAQPGLPMPGRGFESAANNCQSFTMADALEAALTEDRLDALYRVGLVPLATSSASTGIAAARFSEVYNHGLDSGCTTCHSTNDAVTNKRLGNLEWDRHHPATLTDLEATVFSYSDASGPVDGSLGGAAVGDRLMNVFRGEGWRLTNGLYPFGIDGSCAKDADRNGFATTVPAGVTASYAGLSGTTVGIGALVDQFAIGAAALKWDQIGPAVNPVGGNAANGALLMGLCTGCHNAVTPGENAPPSLSVATKYMPPARIFETIMNGSKAGLMPKMGYDEDDARDITAHLVGLPSHVHQQVYNTKAAGFAHLTAMSIVEQVYENLGGYPLSTETRFSRNEDAAAVLDHLTRTFVDSGWSLKALITEIVTSEFANREAPSTSALSAYQLPMIFNPWADTGPTAATVGEDLNGQGDIVHRWPVSNLLLQVEGALGYGAPMFPGTTGYADLGFLGAFGAPISVDRVGFRDVSTGALLAWEAEVGSCENPTLVADTIDILTDPAEGLTLEQAMLEVKFQLVSTNHWWADPFGAGGGGVIVGPGGPQDERSLAAQLSALDLDDPASDDPKAVRDYCAALLMSPQFLLSGLPAWDGATPNDPDPDVPCLHDLCTYDDFCEHYAETALDLGYTWDCELDIVIR